VTSTDGHFRIDGLPPGVYAVEVVRLGFRRWTAENIEVGPGAHPVSAVLEVCDGDCTQNCGPRPVVYENNNGASQLRGVALDQSGRPVPGATISISRMDGTVAAIAVAKSNGEFNAGNFAPAKYTLSITAPGYFETQLSGVRIMSERATIVTLTPTQRGLSKVCQ
jgi:hypothetical protein